MRATFTSVLTLAASVIINVAALAAWEWNVNRAQLPPPGEVTVTQVESAALTPGG